MRVARSVAVYLTNWKLVAWFLGLIPVAGLIYLFAFTTALYSQMSFPMAAHLGRSADATPIRNVWLYSWTGRPRAHWDLPTDATTCRKWISKGDFWKPELSEGNRVNFKVHADDAKSFLGITLDYGQDGQLVVIAELADGRWVSAVADIPDARTTHEMRVTLP